jgi:multidrug efflux system outer membrane protein
LVGCAVGTDYQRPETALPAAHRGGTSDAASFAERDWNLVFTDAPLKALIEEALRAGPDSLLAAARVREAEAVANVVRAGSLPSVGIALTTSPVARRSGDTLTSSFLGGVTASWELDLWGRYARATEAARADLMSSEASRDAINASLVANTAGLYYQLVGLREIEVVTRHAVDSQRDVLRLVRRLSQAGVSSAAEERQQENVVANTEARLPVVQRQIAAAENALSILIGRAPGAILLAAPATLDLPAAVPAGLPSQLLERRPDIVQSEAHIRAANARVGEAKALFYPNISLTAAFGTVSASLSDVLRLQGATVASLGPNLLQPLYAGGALRANEQATMARLDQALLGYRKTILTALGEVADSLNAYQTQGEAMEIQRRRVAAATESMRLAEMRFRAGVAGFLEVLNAQQQLLSAETDQAQTLLDRRLALVQIYLALGGGWRRAPETT